MNENRIKELRNPQDAFDAVNKRYMNKQKNEYKTKYLEDRLHLILPVTKDRLSSLLKTQNDINFGLAKTSVKP